MDNPLFRADTFDEDIWKSVVDNNEYDLPAAFTDVDTILDIGAHIGAFTKACLMRGAGKVLAFEPDFENFSNLHLNFKGEIKRGLVDIYPMAVVGDGVGFRTHSGYTSLGDKINTGGGFLINGTATKPFSPNEEASGDCANVPVIGINSVMGLAGNVRLLKLDVEGMEFEILEHLKFYSKISEIVGEYHCIENHGPKEISEKLAPLGFQVLIIPDGEMGKFWARR